MNYEGGRCWSPYAKLVNWLSELRLKRVYKLEYERSQKISKAMREEHKITRITWRIVVFGRGGVNMLLNHLGSLHGWNWNNLSKEELLHRRRVVFGILVDVMAEFLRSVDNDAEAANQNLSDAKECVIAAKSQVSQGGEVVMNAELREALVTLWNDEGFRAKWEERRVEPAWADALEYFMNSAERVLQNDYGVTERDWLEAQKTSMSVVTLDCIVEATKLRIHDPRRLLGNQEKWVDMFDSVSSVFYVVPIDEYDQREADDISVNRLQQDMVAYEQVVNNGCFVVVDVVLFFTNFMRFREKLLSVPIKVEDETHPESNRWTDYEGHQPVGNEEELDMAYDDGITYFENSFKALTRNSTSRDIYVHTVNFADAEHTSHVMKAVMTSLLSWASCEGYGFQFD